MKQRNYAKSNEVLVHTGLSREMTEGATIALLPGDPGRVAALASKIGEARPLAVHREYTSWLAYVSGKPVLVCSTGMGGPSVGIGLEELARLGLTTFIRVGTTGSLQENLNLGDVVIDDSAVRLDGTSGHYAPPEFPAVADYKVTAALEQAAVELDVPYKIGMSVSSDTFWPGQERYDSFTGYVPRRFQGSLAEWQALGCTNMEMEAATLFTIARVFGLKAGCICGVIAKRTESESIAPPEVYQLAEKRFQMVSKRALEILLMNEGSK